MPLFALNSSIILSTTDFASYFNSVLCEKQRGCMALSNAAISEELKITRNKFDSYSFIESFIENFTIFAHCFRDCGKDNN